MQGEVRITDAPRHKPKLKTPAKPLILDLIDASYAGLFALREKGSAGEAERLQRALAAIRGAMQPEPLPQP